MQVLLRQFQFHIGFDGGQPVGEVGLVLAGLQFFGHGFGAAKFERRHLVEPGINVIQPAQPLQQGQGGFLAHSRHAGNVVRGIAHQGQKIDDQAGLDTKFFLHPRRVHHQTRHGVDQGDVGVHQLRHVLVAGGYDHRTAGGAGLRRQRADHVIRLHTLYTE